MKKKREKQTVDGQGKDFLTEAEMKRFLEAARHGRHGVSDYLMMLMTYRHGLRVSELVDLRLKDLDLETGRLYVRRKKGSLSTHQPIEGDELRTLRAWLREREQRRDAPSPYLFLSERGPMVRQTVNYLVAEIGMREACEATLPRPPTHAASFNRILSGQSQLRHETGAGLSGS